MKAKILPNSLGDETCEMIALLIGPPTPLNIAKPTLKYICHEYLAIPFISASMNPDPYARRHIAGNEKFNDYKWK